MKEINYENIINEIKENVSNGNSIMKHALKFITTDDISYLVDIIISRRLLTDYLKVHNNISNEAFKRVIDSFLPVLFEDNELKSYFFDVVIELEKNEDTWVKPTIEDLYKVIVGYHWRGKRTGVKFPELQRIFQEIFNNTLINEHLYPSIFKNIIIKKIRSNQSLKEENLVFEKEYSNAYYRNFFNYLDKFIITIIGEDVFSNYIRNMIYQYIENIDIINSQTVNNDVFLNYIFGTKFDFCERYKSFDTGKETIHSKIYLLILKEFLPYTIGNYSTKNARNTVYKFLRYSDEEISFMENKYKNFYKHSISVEYSASLVGEDLEYKGYTLKELYSYIDYYWDILIKEIRVLPKYYSFLNGLYHYYEKDEKLAYALRDIKHDSRCNAKIHAYYNKKRNDTKKIFFKDNKKQFDKDIIILYLIDSVENFVSYTIDLTEFPDTELKDILIEYIKFLEKNEPISGKPISRINNNVKSFLKFIISKYEIESIDEVEEWHIICFLNELDVVYNLKPSSMSLKLGDIKRFLSFFIDNFNNNYLNPVDNISISHIIDHQVPTSIIPDDILLYLDKNINKIKQRDVELMYRILGETGWRFGDIRRIKITDITKQSLDNSFATIKVLTKKTKKARIKNGLGAFIEDNISISLYEDLVDYIKKTEYLRNMYGIDVIFFKVANGTCSFLQSHYFNNAIRNFLISQKITSINETCYDFSSRQTRKTVASNLISSGVPVSSIQKKLGHTNSKTTERYYAFVQQKKISELNHDFYKEKFDIYMDEEKLKLFTEEERRILYIDFCLGKRNVELGICSKHPSEGKCIEMGQFSCAKCPKLCTGKKFLAQWEKIMNDSYKLINMFEQKYKELKIPESEYKNYIEYKQEKELYEYYAIVVESIKKGVNNE